SGQRRGSGECCEAVSPQPVACRSHVISSGSGSASATDRCAPLGHLLEPFDRQCSLPGTIVCVNGNPLSPAFCSAALQPTCPRQKNPGDPQDSSLAPLCEEDSSRTGHPRCSGRSALGGSRCCTTAHHDRSSTRGGVATSTG